MDTYEIKIPKKVASTPNAHYALYDLVEVTTFGNERVRDMLRKALDMTGAHQAVYSEGRGRTAHMIKVWDGQEYYAVYSGENFILNGPDKAQCSLILAEKKRLRIGYGQNESTYEYYGDTALVKMFLYDLFAENPAGYGAATIKITGSKTLTITQSASCD